MYLLLIATAAGCEKRKQKKMRRYYTVQWEQHSDCACCIVVSRCPPDRPDPARWLKTQFAAATIAGLVGGVLITIPDSGRPVQDPLLRCNRTIDCNKAITSSPIQNETVSCRSNAGVSLFSVMTILCRVCELFACSQRWQKIGFIVSYPGSFTTTTSTINRFLQ